MYGRVEAFRTYFTVMQFCDGETLSNMISLSGSLPDPESRKIIGQVACSLAYSVHADVLPLDTKPPNILRMIGQIANGEGYMPLNKRANRRRIKTVIQNLIYMAARLVSHARKRKLSFGKWSPWFPAYERVYQQLLC